MGWQLEAKNLLRIFGFRRRSGFSFGSNSFPAAELAQTLGAARPWLQPLESIYITLDHGSFPKCVTMAISKSHTTESIRVSFDSYSDEKIQSLFDPLLSLGFNFNDDTNGFFGEWRDNEAGKLQIEKTIKIVEERLGFRNKGRFQALGPEHVSITMQAVGHFYLDGHSTYLLINHPR
jgi:hypothetical protein